MDDKTRPAETSYRFIGKPLPRKEDERLITGRDRDMTAVSYFVGAPE